MGRKEEKEDWMVATSELGRCCRASRDPGYRCCPLWIALFRDTRGFRQGLCSSS